MFAMASYSILVSVMLLTGRLVARETGRALIGLAAMVAVGTTSLMLAPATWYSAGQPLWAGAAILATLWYAQRYRRTTGCPRSCSPRLLRPDRGVVLVNRPSGRSGGGGLSLVRRPPALPDGGGRAPGCVDRGGWIEPRARRAAHRQHNQLPRPDASEQAASPLRGLAHTGQSIPENLLLGNLGLTVLDHAGARRGPDPFPARRSGSSRGSATQSAATGRQVCRDRAPGICRAFPRARRLSGRVDISRLHGLSVFANDQPAQHRALV